MAKFQAPFSGIEKEWTVLRKRLPAIASEKAVNFFKANFRRQGFLDGKLEKWQQVKRRQEGTNANKYASAAAKTRNILIGRGNLRRSIEPHYSSNRVGTKSNLPYAEVHNEGGKAGRGKGFQMPKRQFMGDSQELFDLLEKELFIQLGKL